MISPRKRAEIEEIMKLLKQRDELLQRMTDDRKSISTANKRNTDRYE